MFRDSRSRPGRSEGFVDLVNTVRLHVADRTDLAAAPDDLYGHLIGHVTCGEAATRFVAGKILAAADHLVRLRRHRAATQCNLRADAASVRRGSMEADGHARSSGVVPEKIGRRIETVHSRIEIAIVVEVGEREAMRD